MEVEKVNPGIQRSRPAETWAQIDPQCMAFPWLPGGCRVELEVRGEMERVGSGLVGVVRGQSVYMHSVCMHHYES